MCSLKLCSGIAIAGVLSVLSAPAAAYDEFVSGDLSGNGLTPTFIALVSGSNPVFGTTGNPGTGTDRDYFSIAIPVGFQLSQFMLLPGSAVIGNSTFLGLQAGTQVTLPANAPSASGLMGAMHYTSAMVGTDLLAVLGVPFAGSSGFTPPLAAGNYAFWVQDFGAGTVPYSFNLVVTAVPEPDTYALMLAALGFTGFIARRRKKQAVSQ